MREDDDETAKRVCEKNQYLGVRARSLGDLEVLEVLEVGIGSFGSFGNFGSFGSRIWKFWKFWKISKTFIIIIIIIIIIQERYNCKIRIHVRLLCLITMTLRISPKLLSVIKIYIYLPKSRQS